MYKILIVDDEKIERNGIKFLLKQLDIDCEIKEAVNGREALQVLKEEEMDILLTDVKMPFMDGIELIKSVRAEGFNIISVIFSGCSEFEYAKQAVRLGVHDYILKPVDPVEFDKTMLSVIDTLEQAKNEANLKEKSIEYMGEHILYLMVNQASIKEIEVYNKGVLSLDFLDEFKRIILVSFQDDFFGKKGTDIKEKIKVRFPQISQYLNLNQQESVLLFTDEAVDFVKIGFDICQYIQETYQEKCYISISSQINSATEIGKAMEELEVLLENKFYHQNSQVFYKGMEKDNEAIVLMEDDTLIKQMKQNVKMKDVSGLRAHFDRFCKKYQRKTDYSQVYIKFLFSNLLKYFYDNLQEHDEIVLNEEIDVLYRATEFETVVALVNKNIDRLENEFGQNPQMLHREIEVIKQYIYQNFQEEISVEQLAEMVYMSSSYLSSVFKKETGQNLSKFIKSYRMEKARQMLEESEMKIVDISCACGYSNVSYFCSSFREYYGISPQKFRENGDELTI